MKRHLIIAAAVLVLISATGTGAQAFRCGSRLVEIGDSKWDLLNRCGQPAWVEEWMEKRWQPYYSEPFSSGRRFYVSPPVFSEFVYVTVQQWFYNFGPTQFTRILTFENNRLTRIETGDYGN